MLELYAPNKFEVTIGQGRGLGFCTVWNQPENIIKSEPNILKECAIIGTLYSRYGVNIILRNLALNPQIRRVVVWGGGQLSKTKFGLSGKEILFSLWKKGLADDGLVVDSNFKLEPEIDPEIIRKIIKNVELIDLSSQPLKNAAKKVKKDLSEPYMQPIRFPDAKSAEMAEWPSEEVGFVTRGKSVLEAWQKLLLQIYFYGTIKDTQYGIKQKELIGASWVIENEDPDKPLLPKDWPKDLKEVTGANKKAIQEYFSVFLSKRLRAGIKYTYGNRIMAWGKEKLDQIEKVIIFNFKDSADTRRAVVSTMIPTEDAFSSEPPCLTQIQFLQAKGKLNALATFRSHDIFKAALPNAFGLLKLQKKVALSLGYQPGKLMITSNSAHIYESDFENVKKLMHCGFIEREPFPSFLPEEADPRGNILIRVDGRKIIVSLVSPEGAELTTFEGKNARILERKLAQLDLLSVPDHLMVIGSELMKAELAIKNNLQYVQDHQLKFNSSWRVKVN